ncbi:MAG: hypothetical protein ACRDC6_20020 [Shewanella sp.]
MMTNEEINALTDRKINEMISAEIGGISGEKYESGQVGAFIYYTLDCGSKLAVEVKNYCNDPAMMMPIAFENGISLINTDGSGEYTACGVGTLVDGYCGDKRNDVYVDGDNLSNIWRDKKPCRAAAIVYLKSKGEL